MRSKADDMANLVYSAWHENEK